jgi:cytochrome c-type biogenesis protein CcmF
MGVGPSLPGGSGDNRTLLRAFWIPSLAGLLGVALCLALGLRGFRPLLTFGLAGFTLLVTLREMFLPALSRWRDKREAPLLALGRAVAKAPRRFGGYVVHLGVVVLFVAIAASQSYVTHATGTLAPGEVLRLGSYQLRFLGLGEGQQPHRRWTSARLELIDANGRTESLEPRMNYYPRSNDPVGSPAVRSGAREDVYLSLLAYSNQPVTASFNAWVFPLVSWIWASVPFFVLGVLISLWPRGRTVPVISSAPASEERGSSAQRGAA